MECDVRRADHAADFTAHGLICEVRRSDAFKTSLCAGEGRSIIDVERDCDDVGW